MLYGSSHSVIGSSYDPAWLTQSFLQGMHKDFKHVHLHPSVALKSQKQTYITFVSPSELFEDVCVAQPPRSWPSLCVCLCVCSHPTYPPLIFIFIRGTEPWQTAQRPQMSTSSTPLLFFPSSSSSLSFSSHSLCSCSSVLEAAVVYSLTSCR